MKIHFNVPGSPHGGGPSVFVWKTSLALKQRGHQIVQDPSQANACVGIIETGKLLKKINRSNTKIVVRIDGIYNDEYNKKFNRAIRPDMIALHNKLKSDIPEVDCVIYQSSWSKERVDSEIIQRHDDNWRIINNGVDTKLFRPIISNPHDGINLIHVGKMRDAYLMECLIGIYTRLRNSGHNVKLYLVGSMDAACKNIFASHYCDPNISHIANKANDQLPAIYSIGDIYLGPRQGSSCDNVIAEAQACGLPVVIPAWGGNKDMVVDRSTGIVVESGHWDYDNTYMDNMAEGVATIMKNLQMYKENARRHAEKNLTINAMVDKYLETFKL